MEYRVGLLFHSKSSVPCAPKPRSTTRGCLRAKRGSTTCPTFANSASKWIAHGYAATGYGLKVAFFYAKLYLRILRPNWTALLPDPYSIPRPLRTALDQLHARIEILQANPLPPQKRAST